MLEQVLHFPLPWKASLVNKVYLMSCGNSWFPSLLQGQLHYLNLVGMCEEFSIQGPGYPVFKGVCAGCSCVCVFSKCFFKKKIY